MSNEMTLFGNQSASALALLQGLEDNLTDKIAGSGGNRRISLENNVFSEVIGGKTVRVSEERAMQVVIINAAPAPEGGCDVLAVVHAPSAAAGTVHLGSLTGAPLRFRPLPYAVP